MTGPFVYVVRMCLSSGGRSAAAIAGLVVGVLCAACSGSTSDDDLAEEPAPTEVAVSGADASDSVDEGSAEASEASAGSEFSTTGPSQSAVAALRDGVLAEIAALAAEDRIGPIDELLASVWTQRIETPEGTYRISRTPRDAFDSGTSGDCMIGDPDGEPYRDWVCVGSDYVEVLVLDRATSEILRAYPFSGTSMSGLQLSDDAVYCFREPDGAYPDLMICRIDRTTGELRVRVWKAPDPGTGVITPWDRWAPDNWRLDVHAPDRNDATPPADRPTVLIQGQQTGWTVDTETLELYEVDCPTCSE